MPGRTRPRVDWSAQLPHQISMNDVDFEACKNLLSTCYAIQADRADAALDEIPGIARTYRSIKANLSNIPNDSEVRAELTRLISLAAELFESVTRTDPKTLKLLTIAAFRHPQNIDSCAKANSEESPQTPGLFRLDEVAVAIDQLRKWAATAQDFSPTAKRGARRRYDVDFLVSQITGVLSRASGQEFQRSGKESPATSLSPNLMVEKLCRVIDPGLSSSRIQWSLRGLKPRRCENSPQE